jgi:NAD(P)-dependent dehydrogenase (short-subunit alcohol dehydrogenase family)
MKGRIALVVGGGAGTGRAICGKFAARGATVVVADINAEGAQKTVDLLRRDGAAASCFVGDIASAAAMQALVAQVEAEHGVLHMAVNNAAVGTPNKGVTQLSEAEWDRCHGATLKGIWLAMKHQLPLIERSGGGAIVNIASVSGLRGEAFQSAYAAAKGGVITLSKAVATEYAKRGIRVNTVCPGGINSGGMQMYLESMPEMRDRVLNSHAMGRLAEPEEIADAAVYLCSEQASFITGHDLVVDGGILVRSNVIEL